MLENGGMDMSKIVSFPNHSSSKPVDPLADVKSLIQERFGVTLADFSVIGGKRTEEAQKKIDRAMQKETLLMASR